MNDLFEFSEQFRLVRFQVANWGTFSGIHDIPISEKGHLFVGGSGSGKSTLLDAMSVLLVPRRYLNFNAAAREGEKSRGDRNFVTYIRGAWSNRIDEHGCAETEYLRKDSTWSAVALTYKSNLKREATFLFIGYIKGNSCDNQSVKQAFFFIPSNFAIDELKDFAKTQFNLAWIKKTAVESEYFDTFASYSDHLMKYFGISDNTVLRLLHKAQSAKNMGDINDFLRNYMLEQPRTFEIADSLADEFSQLNSAWLTVRKARDQIFVLSPARDALEESHNAALKAEHFKDLSSYVHYWRALVERDGYRQKMPAVEEKLRLSNGHLVDLNNDAERVAHTIEDLKIQSLEKGGARIERLENDLANAKVLELRVAKDAERAKDNLNALQLSMPSSGREFEQVMLDVRNKQESASQELTSIKEQRDETVGKRQQAEHEFSNLVHEIEIMQKHRSNIPADLLELREEFCRELGLSELDLPFVGELIQVKEEQKNWQGALERVVHQFALSILVSDDGYAAFSKMVNDRHLGVRLVYHRVPSLPVNVMASPDEHNLPAKFEVKASPFTSWIKSELLKRFNYACVEDPKDLEHYEKAVTLLGQVKHNRTRHEKDDRHRVDDPTYWVTGFSIHDKLKLFKSRAQKTALLIEKLKKALNEFEMREDNLRVIQNAALRLSEIEWKDIDHARILLSIKELEQQLQIAKKGNTELAKINEELKKQQDKYAEFEKQITEITKEIGYLEREFKNLQDKLEVVEKLLQTGQINEDFNIELEKLSRSLVKRMTLSRAGTDIEENIGALCNELVKYLSEKIVTFNKRAEDQCSKMVQYFADFMRQWPEESSELTADRESADEFMHKLAQLENDGLPKYEKRFRELLENTTSQNLIDLYRCIDDERRLIKERLNEVNISLSQVPFNRSDDQQTHLQICVSYRRLEDVKEFERLYRKVMNDVTATKMQEDEAEKRFAELKTLVNKLSGGTTEAETAPTTADLKWRENVLDVRLHVEFRGEESDENGNVIEVYDSGTGKSGGQRQKLTTTCLAAALRYQLGGSADTKPKYAPVVLDEAFDKADNDFTDISLQVFEQFGFQLIIATPLKGVHTIEPYIGKADVVDCRNRNDSYLMEIDLKQLLAQEEAMDQLSEASAT